VQTLLKSLPRDLLLLVLLNPFFFLSFLFVELNLSTVNLAEKLDTPVTSAAAVPARAAAY
jgi:hypothetical protein